MLYPHKRCISNLLPTDRIAKLTIGKVYQVLEIFELNDNTYYRLVDDSGYVVYYNADRFEDTFTIEKESLSAVNLETYNDFTKNLFSI
jgi:hypothetical protein